MLIFRSLDLERMLIWQNFFLWKSAIFHSIKLPFDAEVAKKFLNVIYIYICNILYWKPLSKVIYFSDRNSWKILFPFIIFVSVLFYVYYYFLFVTSLSILSFSILPFSLFSSFSFFLDWISYAFGKGSRKRIRSYYLGLWQISRKHVPRCS